MIKFVDLNRQYEQIKDEIHAKIDEVIRTKDFVQGRFTRELEKEYGAMHGFKHMIPCSSGSTAVLVAISSLGLREGDEVITTPHTFIATSEPIHHLKAKPVFVDIDPVTYNIDTTKIEQAITEKTRAIAPVHLYGNPADMEEIMRIAKKHNLMVMEDCAHAHFAKLNGRFVGTFGDINAVSFNPGKNLGAYGDAGAIVSGSDELYNRAKKIFDHGRLDKYTHDVIGYNLRMDDIQAAVLLVKIKYILEWTKKRQENAALYTELFSGNPKIVTPKTQKGGEHVYHLYVIQVENRDGLMAHLKEKGIDVRNHYPVPLHIQPAFDYLGYKKGDFPVTESVASRVVSLPIFPELTKDEIKFIADEVNSFVR